MKQINWADFAEKLNNKHGSVHTTHDDDEVPNPNPPDLDYWLQDVTVSEITDFVKDYLEPEIDEQENKFISRLSNLDADTLRKLIFTFWRQMKTEGEHDMATDASYGSQYRLGAFKLTKANYLSALAFKAQNDKEITKSTE